MPSFPSCSVSGRGSIGSSYCALGTDLCQVPWQRGIVFAKDDCKPSRRTDLVKYVRSCGERIAQAHVLCLLGKHLGVC